MSDLCLNFLVKTSTKTNKLLEFLSLDKNNKTVETGFLSSLLRP